MGSLALFALLLLGLAQLSMQRLQGSRLLLEIVVQLLCVGICLAQALDALQDLPQRLQVGTQRASYQATGALADRK